MERYEGMISIYDEFWWYMDLISEKCRKSVTFSRKKRTGRPDVWNLLSPISRVVSWEKQPVWRCGNIPNPGQSEVLCFKLRGCCRWHAGRSVIWLAVTYGAVCLGVDSSGWSTRPYSSTECSATAKIWRPKNITVNSVVCLDSWDHAK